MYLLPNCLLCFYYPKAFFVPFSDSLTYSFFVYIASVFRLWAFGSCICVLMSLKLADGAWLILGCGLVSGVLTDPIWGL